MYDNLIPISIVLEKSTPLLQKKMIVNTLQSHMPYERIFSHSTLIILLNFLVISMPSFNFVYWTARIYIIYVSMSESNCSFMLFLTRPESHRLKVTILRSDAVISNWFIFLSPSTFFSNSRNDLYQMCKRIIYFTLCWENGDLSAFVWKNRLSPEAELALSAFKTKGCATVQMFCS